MEDRFGSVVTRQDAVKQVVTLWKREEINSKELAAKEVLQQQIITLKKREEEITQKTIIDLQSRDKEIQSLKQELNTLQDKLQKKDKELQSQLKKVDIH